jgi:hypothetical protein
MPAELTLESLTKELQDVKTLVAGIKVGSEEDEKKKLEAKKAEEEKKEEEKKEAKKASRTAALKQAMEEKDDEKRDAAIRKAMSDDTDEKKHEAFGKPDEEKTAEEKEKDEHVASIIEKDRQTYINKILTAATITNPQNVKEIEAVVKSASITKLKEMALMTPDFEASVKPTMQEEKFIPYFASTQTDTDNEMLTASNPPSDFTKFSTKELLEMNQ